MKLFTALIILFILSNCSFDDKTGIWKNENTIKTDVEGPFKDFKTISNSKKIFDKTITLDKKMVLNLSQVIKNSQWTDPFYSDSNNTNNFKYNGNYQLILNGKKLSKYKSSKILLYHDDNIILNDVKGNVIVYSIIKKEIIRKFNFYKNKYKGFKKNLNFVIDKNIIYVSDNLGYIYAFDYQSNSLLWAKNLQIPFKSNLKIYKNIVISASHKNNIFFLNKNNGEIIKSIPTEETKVTNQFVNNFSIKDDNLFFLNSFGSLYSINLKLKTINWFINLNQSLELTSNNLFKGNQIINGKNRIIVSSDKLSYLLDSQTGNILSKSNYLSNLKPIINNELIFFVTKNNFLIAAKLDDGGILYSYDIKNQLSKFLNINKKLEINNFFLVNNKIFLFINNKYVALFNVNGRIEKINKLPSKIKTNPIFIDGSIMYLDNKNKLKIVD